MKNLLTDILESQVGSGFSGKAAQAAGISPDKSQMAIESAIPFLLGALAKNSSKPEGAQALGAALKKNHDGSVFGHIDDLFNESGQKDGAGILKHVLGNKQSEVERFLSEKNGIKSDQAGSLLKSLAPIVMGALGKAQKDSSMDTGQLSSLLNLAAGQFSGGKSGIPLSMLSKFLDSDGDGKISDDLLSMGVQFLKKRFFK